MGGGRHEDDALPIRDRGRREAADGAVEKLLILIELDDVIARPRTCQQSAPGLAPVQAVRRSRSISGQVPRVRLVCVRRCAAGSSPSGPLLFPGLCGTRSMREKARMTE